MNQLARTDCTLQNYAYLEPKRQLMAIADDEEYSTWKLDIFTTKAILSQNGADSTLQIYSNGQFYGEIPLEKPLEIVVEDRYYLFKNPDLTNYPNSISTFIDHPDTDFVLGRDGTGIGTADIRDLRETRRVTQLKFNLQGVPPNGTSVVLVNLPHKPAEGLTIFWKANYWPY